MHKTEFIDKAGDPATLLDFRLCGVRGLWG